MIAHDYELSPRAKEFFDNFNVRNIFYVVGLIWSFMFGFIMAGGV